MTQTRKLFCFGFQAIAFAILLGFVPAQFANAQNQFTPAGNTSNDFGQWTPPNTQQAAFAGGATSTNANSNGPVVQSTYNAPVGVGFPDAAAPFDSNIRSAEFASPTNEPAGSLEANIDSAAATFGKWKDIAGEKASGWFGGLSSEGSWFEKVQSLFGKSSGSKVIGSLALVLGIYFSFVWLMRKFGPFSNAGLPSEVLEVMGQVPFGPKRSLQIVRLGTKLILLMNSVDGTQTLGEITDHDEVEYLSSLCQGKSASRPTRQPAPARELRPSPSQSSHSTTAGTNSSPRNIGATNLSDVIQILQQANTPQNGTLFEA